MLICSCISWSLRPSNWSIVGWEEEEDVEDGERWYILKEGKPVAAFFSGQQRGVAIYVVCMAQLFEINWKQGNTVTQLSLSRPNVNTTAAKRRRRPIQTLAN